MRLVAQAPGKLVLLGEYAVLEGAPALVLAVDREARVTLDTDPRAGCDLVLEAPDIGVATACASTDPSGQLHWHDAVWPAQRLELVTRIWNALASGAPHPLTGVRLRIDNAGFFEGVGSKRCKLGLGSSAALTVALAGVLTAARRAVDTGATSVQPDDGALPRPDLTQLISLHRSWQHAQGSGLDVAASLTGGLICYQQSQGKTAARVQAAHWPPAGTYWAFIWSGEPVSTTDALQHLAQWRRQSPAAYQANMAELGALARMLPQAMAARATDFITLVAQYRDALMGLGRASGLIILTPRQVQLSELAAKEGVSYKPCGAGGDIGVAVADDPERLARLRPHLARLALRVLPLSVAARGLQIRRITQAAAPARNHVG